ncbi:monovalent cation/H(+) antiporter subunit G [Methanohalophilus profundi]|uniref:monovalent cation/H(+) antiporter subunit G n=1 Tax=Methanohalophilus profundi TaxID=2138083 RepID=UPI001CDB9BE6|nr:monovalent cation/H(+) antiporter subunit G [Methanohalophilus profundi]
MNNITVIQDILSNFFFFAGMFFVFLGMLGLYRLPDVYNRLHATTKIGTLGAFGVMMGIVIKLGFGPMGIKAITVGLFLLLTAPVAAHMISRAAHRHGVGLCEESTVDDYGKTYCLINSSCPVKHEETIEDEHDQM